MFATATVVAMLVTGTAKAATLTVTVTDSAGRPVRDAVVVADLPGKHAPAAGRDFAMQQMDIAFHPFVLVVPVGAKVSFPNGDNTRHQVYSFSTPKRFELKLFARDQTRSVVFDHAGVVALGCNIHDRMSAFVYVTDNAWTARTDDHGVAVLPDVPDAPGRIVIWHPYQRSVDNTQALPLAAGQRNATVAIHLRAPPMRGMGSY